MLCKSCACVCVCVHVCAQGRYQSVFMFVDNAGSDLVLGMIPLARELLRNGAQVG